MLIGANSILPRWAHALFLHVRAQSKPNGQAAAAADAGLPPEEATTQLKLDAYSDLRLPERALTAVVAVYRGRGLPAPTTPLELLEPMARLSELPLHS